MSLPRVRDRLPPGLNHPRRPGRNPSRPPGRTPCLPLLSGLLVGLLSEPPLDLPGDTPRATHWASGLTCARYLLPLTVKPRAPQTAPPRPEPSLPFPCPILELLEPPRGLPGGLFLLILTSPTNRDAFDFETTFEADFSCPSVPPCRPVRHLSKTFVLWRGLEGA